MASSIPISSGDHRILALITNPRGQLAFAILALCAIVAFDAFFYLYRPYDGMGVETDEPFGQVLWVHPDGPAAEAGVLAGDQILAIDGQRLNRWISRPQYRPGLRPGDVAEFDFLRGTEALSVPIVLGSYRDNLPLLGSFLGMQFLSVSFWTVGLVLVLFVPPADVRARLLGLGFLMAGITAAVGGASGWNSFWGANTVQQVLFALVSPVLVAAHLTFPAISFPRQRQRVIHSFAAVSILLVAGALLDDLGAGFLSTALSARIGLHLRQIVLAFFLVAWFASLGLLIRNRFLAADPETKRQTGIVIWGMALGIGPFFALTLLPYLMFDREYIPGYYTVLFLLILPLAYAYVIFQRRLLQVDFIINRLVVFFVLVLLILIASILAFGMVALALDLPADVPLWGGLVAAMIALPAAGLHRFVQQKVNLVLYGSHYDFSTVTSGLSSRLARTLDRGSLVQLLTESLAGQMGIQKAAVLLIEGSQLRLQRSEGGAFAAPLDDEMCVVLRDSQTPVRGANLWQLLTDPARERWAHLRWGQLFAPLIFEERLHGILILGARTSGDVYSDQDIQIIATVAHQGALASANVLLVEDLRGLAQQLVRSDEAQRKRLARDLHDAVLQDLFFIKQRLPRDQDYPKLADHLEALIQKLRGLIKAQRPSLLDQGIAFALQGLVEDMQRMAGASPRLLWQSSLNGRINLTDEQATCLFRIAQEAISNALKHARAAQIRVKLEPGTKGALRLTIQDDGVGYAPARAGQGTRGSQYGLVGMHERARMIDASLEIRARPGEGTAVVLEFTP